MSVGEFEVPAEDEAIEISSHIGASLLELVPGVGATAARALDFKMARRRAARDRAFQVAVVAALKELSAASGDQPTIEKLLDSDEFVSAFDRCSRVAAETASDTKRARLARAAASAVVKSTLHQAELDTFLDLIERYSDLHVWLLAFYCDPAGWLVENGQAAAAHPLIRGGKRDEPLRSALGELSGMAVVKAAIEDLQRDQMLGVFSLDEVVGERKQFAPQTRRRARRLLRFIDEPVTQAPAPPLP